MEIRYYKNFSPIMGRDMEFKVYGHTGKPILFVPCQGGRFWDFESFRMIDTWAKWIEAGKVTVYSIDTIDNETWANFTGDARWRIEQHERWFNYIVDEMVPTIRYLNAERNGGHELGISTFGCSLGAMHAANLFFRRPDLFDGVLGLSGTYDTTCNFGGYMDDLVYANSPSDFLANMPSDHHYIDMYNQRKIILCVGQGAWEDELKAGTGRLKGVLESKGIHAWIDFWGHDVDHDWNWWFTQCDYYVPYLLGEK